MMELASAAYLESDAAKKAIEKAGLRLVQAGSRKVAMSELGEKGDSLVERLVSRAVTVDAQYLVVDRGDALVVAFRGSKEGADYLLDVVGSSVDAMDGRGAVHAGFRRQLDAVWPELEATLRRESKRSDPAKPIVFTGHSMGAALAVLGASRWEEGTPAGKAVHSVYGFALPASGDAAFTADYGSRLGSRTFSFINQGDLVPRLLQRLGYANPEVHVRSIARDGTLVRNPTQAQLDADLRSDLLPRKLKDLLPLCLEEHRPPYYLRRLQALAATTAAHPAGGGGWRPR